jgi:hypothetical protein
VLPEGRRRSEKEDDCNSDERSNGRTASHGGVRRSMRANPRQTTRYWTMDSFRDRVRDPASRR